MEKLIRTISMEVRPKKGEAPVMFRNVEFDMSNLSREQLADWCVNASSLRVNFQNRVRPKGRTYLEKIAQETVKVTVQPCGTRAVPVMSDKDMMIALLKSRYGVGFEEFLLKHESIEEAFLAFFGGKANEEEV